MSSFANEMMNLLISITTGSEKNSSKSTSKVKEEEGFYVWDKGENLELSKYFKTKEFTCHCHFPDCKKQRIDKELISKLDKIREEIGQPLVVTSAFRCTKHQAFLRSAGVNTVVAKKISQHELGKAADIVPADQKNVKTKFLDIVRKHFTAIGLSTQFLHVDLRKEKIEWDY